MMLQIIPTVCWMQIWTTIVSASRIYKPLCVCVCDHFFLLSAHKGPRLPPHAEPREMNKAPQPITGSPSTPHPAPSPGLSQVSFPGTSGYPPPSFLFLLFPPKEDNCCHADIMHIIRNKSHYSSRGGEGIYS